MKERVSDCEIRSELRSLCARSRIDLQRIQIAVASGVVRMGGEVSYHGASSGGKAAAMRLENLERDIVSLKGVRSVSFDFRNWRRMESGEWTPAEEARVSRACSS